MLCCAVLCCAVLCCAVLCCAVLCCAVLCYAVRCCANKLSTGFCLQLVIYGINGDLVPNENLQNPDTAGAIHNITHYLITYLVPGGPTVPIFTVIAAVNERNETAEVASAFDAAVVAGYIPQLIALLKQVSCPENWNCRSLQILLLQS